MQTLPDELKLLIFSYLSPKARMQARGTCAEWRRLLLDRALWNHPSQRLQVPYLHASLFQALFCNAPRMALWVAFPFLGASLAMAIETLSLSHIYLLNALVTDLDVTLHAGQRYGSVTHVSTPSSAIAVLVNLFGNLQHLVFHEGELRRTAPDTCELHLRLPLSLVRVMEVCNRCRPIHVTDVHLTDTPGLDWFLVFESLQYAFGETLQRVHVHMSKEVHVLTGPTTFPPARQNH